VKKLTGQKREEIARIQDKDKVMHTKQQEIAEVFSEYFRKASECEEHRELGLGEEDQGAEA